MASLSASAENISSNTGGGGGSGSTSNGMDGASGSDAGGSSMCLELALEGERLCKSGDCRAGVAFFQAAIQAGTDDLRTLSAIYSQLGNAYFYLGDYSKAMQYHKLDLTLARSMNDKLGEAKSSGNLGNTLKVMGRFDEAAICCERHLTLARQLGDKLSEGRALYNLGNVYHAKGKHLGQRTPGDFGDDVKEALSKAVEYYKDNLKLMRDLCDRSAQGRACGNLGNTYYLLGDFQAAIEHHQERLRIAREFGDKPAERRANSNLGNSHIFLGQFEEAANHYKRTLELAVELSEREVEAQSCYSLGNTYTLLREFGTAIGYHQRHLAIAEELADRVGEARACWSLGNAHSAIGQHEQALKYAEGHLKLAKQLHDPVGESTARVNIADLRKLLGLPESYASPTADGGSERRNSNASDFAGHQSDGSEGSQGSRMVRVRRQSMEQLDLIKITPDKQRAAAAAAAAAAAVAAKQTQLQEEGNQAPKNKSQEDDFFEMLSRSQSKRMDDQRCSIPFPKTSNTNSNINKNNNNNSNSSNATGATRKPLVQQNSISTVEGAGLPGLKNLTGASGAHLARSATTTQQPDDAFLDMLMRCQGSRLEDQRSELPRPNITRDDEATAPAPLRGRKTGATANNGTVGRVGSTSATSGGATVPDEDFFSLIMKVQSGRMDDQRASIPFISRPAQGAKK